MCTIYARMKNPIRAYKDRHALTYVELAERLGISEDYARKLGASLRCSMSPAMARQLESRTRGGIRYLEVMRWIDWHQRRKSSGSVVVA